MEEQLALYLADIGNLEESDRDYISRKYMNIMNCTDELDEKLNSISMGWKTSRMNRVDLTVLRLAVYELTLRLTTTTFLEGSFTLKPDFGLAEVCSSFLEDAFLAATFLSGLAIFPRIPFSNAPDSSEPKHFASSTASLMATPTGTSSFSYCKRRYGE